MLLCLVTCLFDLAYFFLPSFSSLIKTCKCIYIYIYIYIYNVHVPSMLIIFEEIKGKYRYKHVVCVDNQIICTCRWRI